MAAKNDMGNIPIPVVEVSESHSGGNTQQTQRRKLVERRLQGGETLMRLFILLCALFSAIRMGRTSQTREIFTVKKEATFRDMKALVFLVVMDGIIASYSLLQGLLCVFSLCSGSPLLSKPFACCIFAFDQILAYLSLAAASAAAEAASMAERGEAEFGWMNLCAYYQRFCDHIGEGIISSFLSTVIMATVSGISAYRFFRLCQPKSL